jgi:hypothetical protein
VHECILCHRFEVIERANKAWLDRALLTYSGREEDGAAPGTPRRGGAAAAVRSGHVRRRHL